MIYFIDGYTEKDFGVVEKIIFKEFHFYYNNEKYCFKDNKIKNNVIPSSDLTQILSNKLKKIFVLNPKKQELFLRQSINAQNERSCVLSKICEHSKTKDVFVYQHFDTFAINFLEKRIKNIRFIRYVTNPFTTKANTEDVMDFLDYLINFNDDRIQTIFENTSKTECEKFFYINKKAWENNEFA